MPTWMSTPEIFKTFDSTLKTLLGQAGGQWGQWVYILPALDFLRVLGGNQFQSDLDTGVTLLTVTIVGTDQWSYAWPKTGK